VTMVAETVDAVIGGDTHRDTHSLEMTAPNGTTIATLTIDNNACGFAEALAWIAEHAPGHRIVVGLEGTRSYGIGLARALDSAGLSVVEVECPRRRHRRRGKSDPIDARLAALEVLRMDDVRKPLPRRDGEREAIRILLGARCDLTVARTAQTNRLRALLLTGDDDDRLLARLTMSEHNLGVIARRRGHSGESTEAKVRRAEARRLALAIRDSARVLADNKRQLAELVDEFAPGLQDRLGVGPVSGGQLIVSWSHRGRCRHEAAFAALAGVSPVPANSGRTHRHRLNRGGDRHLNRALHDIVLTRWRMCPRTHAYIAASRARGKSDAEIRRALKRYTARELFRVLNASVAH
jgi:transposase